MATKKRTTQNQKSRNAAQSRRKKKATKKIFGNNLVIGVLLIIVGCFTAYSYIDFNAGIAGDLVSQGFSYCFGSATLLICFYFVALGIILCINKIDDWAQNFVLVFLLLVNLMIIFTINTPNLMGYSIPELFSLAQYGQYGGIIGILLAVLLIKLFAVKGTILLVVISSILMMAIIFKNSLKKYWQNIKDKNKDAPSLKNRVKDKIAAIKDKRKIKNEVKATKDRTSETAMIPPISAEENDAALFEPLHINGDSNKSLFKPVNQSAGKSKKKTKTDPFGFIEEEVIVKEPPIKIHENFLNPSDLSGLSRGKIDNGINEENKMADHSDFSGLSRGKIGKDKGEEAEHLNQEKINLGEEIEEYTFPSLDLLNPPAAKKKSKKDDVIKKAKIIEDTLKNFGVRAKIIEVNVGPSITRFELQLAPGVKVNKIVNLANDLALSLATSDIRIEAPIPGKAAVGIEVPNEVSEIVGLREIIDTPEFKDSKSPLTFALGKTLTGESIIGDIGKMPHVLIAGATGSGKSVCINSIITSLIFKSSPAEVRFIMIDPKMVELSQYNAIPHLLIPVVTDPKKAAYALNWGLKEMTERYMLFKDSGVRDIEGYNELIEKSGDKKLPRIVIVIDELADLMITSPKEVENAICRIAQLARACGIHLIIATQRPSVDVITGLIKANIPSRIAFAVASNTDSRTILDTGGAEKLLGKGDMLYYPVGQSKPTRVQCTYVSDHEINAVIDAVEVKKGKQYDASIEDEISKEPEEKKPKRDGDVLLEDAIKIAFEYNQISTSMLQRKLQVGYARAGRIIDDLEERGIISGPNGSKPREILVTEDEIRNRE
ncbi:DNA translocase FtsK [Acetobacterium paludosum]|uniref:DNA translocase FtsK n=1 Tax=Acetobacterium paludosum TaxID=52693 RepID=A0A923KX64_9FIRM|nr:DNA translocase FtsK [Acetobacterium paludosum]MBC3888918.1 DNA translocase FtsK [Acetobacterium paludosum]